jgi:hypothetical protein
MKKNIIKNGILAFLLAISFNTPKLEVVVNGYPEVEKKMILKAASLEKKHNLPYEIVFECDSNLSDSGVFKGVTNQHYLIRTEPISAYTNRFLTEGSKPEYKDWDIPYVFDPTETLVLHEIGHAFFDRLDEREKKSFESLCKSLDYTLPENSGLTGFCSFHSYYFKLVPEYNRAFPPEQIQRYTSEQFAEIYLYSTLKHHYRDKDPIFVRKKQEVERQMKNFEKK